MKLKNKLAVGLLAITLAMNCGCEDFLTQDPSTYLPDRQVTNDATGLEMLLKGAYRMMRDGDNNPAVAGPLGINLLSTCSGWDMMVNEEQVGNNWYFYTYSTQRYDAANSVPGLIWTVLYKVIVNTNIILENVDNAEGDQSAKDAIKGQALALRARCYFNLVRLYQHTFTIATDKPGVPLQLTSELEPKARATVREVYDQIVGDLTTAAGLLADYARPSKDFYDIDVVNFLLANVYLTKGDWANAQSSANKVRSAYDLMTIAEYKAGFSTINREWVLGYVQGTQDYWWYDSPACWFDFGQNNAPWQAEQLLPSKAFVEEVMKDDPRLLVIDNPIYQGKYAATKFLELKDESPYGDLLDMRAAEMYLVEAEAAARQENITVALQVLNTLQRARGAQVTTTTSKDELISAILLERRKELWGEGFEWFDILRLQLPVERTTAQGHYQNISIPVNSNKLIMMIPEKEVINNDLLEQNPHPDQEPVFVP